MYAKQVSSLLTAVRLAATGAGSAVDIVAFHGQAKLVLNASATEAADNTADLKITHSDTEGGEYTDSGVAFAQVVNGAASHQVLNLNVDEFKRWVKVDYTLAGTTPKVTASVELIGKKQST